MLGKEIVENLNRAIEALLKEASELGPSEERTTRVVDIVRVVLEVKTHDLPLIRKSRWLSLGRSRRESFGETFYLECGSPSGKGVPNHISFIN